MALIKKVYAKISHQTENVDKRHIEGWCLNVEVIVPVIQIEDMEDGQKVKILFDLYQFGVMVASVERATHEYTVRRTVVACPIKNPKGD